MMSLEALDRVVERYVSNELLRSVFLGYLRSLNSLARNNGVVEAKLREMCPKFFEGMSERDREVVWCAMLMSLLGMCRRKAIECDELCSEVYRLSSEFQEKLVSLALSGSVGFRTLNRFKKELKRILDSADKVCGKKRGLLSRLLGK